LILIGRVQQGQSFLYSIVPLASMKNQAKPLITVTSAAKSKA
jgi:hypothetical protein